MKSLIVALLFLAVNATAAMDYDVDMPNSGDPKYDMIRITIDGCVSKFKVEKKELESFSSQPENLKKLIAKAIKRSVSGCPRQP